MRVLKTSKVVKHRHVEDMERPGLGGTGLNHESQHFPEALLQGPVIIPKGIYA